MSTLTVAIIFRKQRVNIMIINKPNARFINRRYFLYLKSKKESIILPTFIFYWKNIRKYSVKGWKNLRKYKVKRIIHPLVEKKSLLFNICYVTRLHFQNYFSKRTKSLNIFQYFLTFVCNQNRPNFNIYKSFFV